MQKRLTSRHSTQVIHWSWIGGLLDIKKHDRLSDTRSSIHLWSTARKRREVAFWSELSGRALGSILLNFAQRSWGWSRSAPTRRESFDTPTFTWLPVLNLHVYGTCVFIARMVFVVSQHVVWREPSKPQRSVSTSHLASWGTVRVWYKFRNNYWRPRGRWCRIQVYPSLTVNFHE